MYNTNKESKRSSNRRKGRKMNKQEFLQLVKLDDSITQLNLGVMYDELY